MNAYRLLKVLNTSEKETYDSSVCSVPHHTAVPNRRYTFICSGLYVSCGLCFFVFVSVCMCEYVVSLESFYRHWPRLAPDHLSLIQTKNKERVTHSPHTRSAENSGNNRFTSKSNLHLSEVVCVCVCAVAYEFLKIKTAYTVWLFGMEIAFHPNHKKCVDTNATIAYERQTHLTIRNSKWVASGFHNPHTHTRRYYSLPSPSVHVCNFYFEPLCLLSALTRTHFTRLWAHQQNRDADAIDAMAYVCVLDGRWPVRFVSSK